MRKIHILNAIIFLAAFLMFQIELIISKIFVPKFGGSYLVWGACCVFFQAVLLGGYLYAHVSTRRLGIWRYRRWHLVLYALPLLVFPGRALPAVVAHQSIPLVLDVFGQLAAGIGLGFFALSTAAIILQSWLAASELPEQSNPYALYAVSNLGSFCGLLTYPFVFELFLDLPMQLAIWRISYAALLALQVIAFMVIRKGREEPVFSAAAETDTPAVSSADSGSWFLWSAAGVIAFLSVTNIITYEVAPVPLLWTMPLCIYLLSFVLIFKKNPWCPSWVTEKFHLVVAFSVMLFFLVQQRNMPLLIQVVAYAVPLFAVCMFCQNSLARSKPRSHKGLTAFYVMIALGGFAGGILTTWIVPVISTGMVEYLLVFLAMYAALMIQQAGEPIGFRALRYIFYLVIMIIAWPMAFNRYNIFGIVMLVTVFYAVYTQLRSKPKAIFMSVLVITLITPLNETLWTSHFYLYSGRNYYGIYRVYDSEGRRYLMNGTTVHGGQNLQEDTALDPLTYYHKGTPIYQLMKSPVFVFPSVGVIGLGAGSMAALVSQGQEVDFYELDPAVYAIAARYFSFLKRSLAHLRYIFGDARVNIMRNADKRYDLLIVDAFSGDSIPVHLITTDAIMDYKQRLAPKGVMVFHTSNRYMDLIPVLFSNARATGAFVCTKDNTFSREDNALSASSWVALTWDKEAFQTLTSQLGWQTMSQGRPVREVRAWTDSYSSILPVLRMNSLLIQFKKFRSFEF